MFSHIYHITGPDNENLCNNADDFTDEEFADGGGWTCELSDSIEKSFSIFFNFDIPSGVPLAITYLYAFVMEIFLLNVLIAVICSAFDKVQSESETRFWMDRHEIVDEVQNIASILPSWITNWCQQDFLQENERYELDFFMPESIWSRFKAKKHKDGTIKDFNPSNNKDDAIKVFIR